MKQRLLAGLLAVVLVLGLRYASLFFGWRTKPPRDYSDVVPRAVSKPVRSVANRVRPPKGKVERDKERHGYEKLRVYNTLYFAVELTGLRCRIAYDGYFIVRVPAKYISRKAARRTFAFAVLGRHEYH